MFKKFINWLKKLFSFNPFRKKSFLYYLCGGEALPKALTDEEEKMYVDMLSSNADFAKQKLIEHNIRLVVYIAKKFENTEVDVEDLISVGSIGLIKAINSYNSDKNIKVATYASKCIENEILMYLRKISKQRQEISFDETINFDSDGNELSLCDILPREDENPQKDVEKSSEKQILWRVINNLSSRERQIMIMRFGLDGQIEKTQKEVADMLGISQSYISRLEKKIFSRIRREMLKLA